MAEFPELGGHCAKTDCKQLDFLPFNCSYCNLIFCQIHFPLTQHTCTRYDNIANTGSAGDISIWICGVDKCGKHDALEILCSACHSHFCLQHRHASQHACISLQGIEEQEKIRKEKFEAPVKEFKDAKSAVEKEINLKLRSAKNRERASKIQLMRLKSKANIAKLGLNIPLSERLHFNVCAPKKIGGDVVIVVSSAWSLGRTLDVAAQACKAPNTNNQPNTPQLRIFNEDMTPVAQHQMHETLSNLIKQKHLIDGQTLVLEYCI